MLVDTVMKHFHVPELVTGILLVILIFTVSAGGLKRLTHITQNLVPAMALLYVVSGLLIILFNITRLPQVLTQIVTSAFGWRPALGGAASSMMIAMQKVFGSSIAKKFKYVFPLFCLIGAVTAIDIVWTIQDIALGFLTIPNLIALIFLSPQVKKCSDEYWKQKKAA